MSFVQIYTFLGGLGIFFFGMKTLSESLQTMAGDLIRKVINALTNNRVMGVGVGAFVTTLVQSSSVTTVMVVGLVNAGLMDLTQAIGVIFGANIGTTITGWIIAIKVGKYGLMFVAMGVFPMLFAKSEKIKQFGRFLFALGFIFMGLKWMSGSMKPLKDTEAFMNLLQFFTADHLFSLLACIAIGACLTFIVQSSSAMLGVTIALAMTGAITFQTAVALVLGENIGTTITALLASVGANSSARRAARAHAFFNVLGVTLMIPCFWYFIDFVDYLIGGNPDFIGEDGGKPLIAVHIASAHSLFNVTMVIVFLPFLNHIARLVTWLTPAPKRKEVPHLKFLPSEADIAPSIALTAAEQEIGHFSDIVKKVFKQTSEYLLADRPDKKVRDKILHLEDVTDKIQAEVTLFLCKTQEARLSFEQSSLSYSLIRAADELESIADYCVSLTRHKDRLFTAEEELSAEAKKDLKLYLQNTYSYFDSIMKTSAQSQSWNLEAISKQSDELNNQAKKILAGHRERLQKSKCSPLCGIFFNDMISGLRKMRAHSKNFAEAMAGKHEEGEVG